MSQLLYCLTNTGFIDSHVLVQAASCMFFMICEWLSNLISLCSERSYRTERLSNKHPKSPSLIAEPFTHVFTKGLTPTYGRTLCPPHLCFLRVKNIKVATDTLTTISGSQSKARSLSNSPTLPEAEVLLLAATKRVCLEGKQSGTLADAGRGSLPSHSGLLGAPPTGTPTSKALCPLRS